MEGKEQRGKNGERCRNIRQVLLRNGGAPRYGNFQRQVEHLHAGTQDMLAGFEFITQKQMMDRHEKILRFLVLQAKSVQNMKTRISNANKNTISSPKTIKSFYYDLTEWVDAS
jgi:hypothetical protein